MSTQTDLSVHTRADIREALLEIRRITGKKSEGDEYYRLDRDDASSYFRGYPKWERKIGDYLRSLHESEAVYVDICGRAQGSYLGAREHYSFSLQPLYSWQRRDSNREEQRFCGDIFSTRDFNAFLSLLKRNGDAPALVTFEPIAGLENYIPHKGSKTRAALNSEVTFQLLEHALRRLVAVMRPGGYILLGPPFHFGTNLGDFLQKVPQEKYQSTLYVKALCRKFKCSVEVGSSINGPRWLIRKREAKSKTDTCPL